MKNKTLELMRTVAPTSFMMAQLIEWQYNAVNQSKVQNTLYSYAAICHERITSA